MQGEAARRAGNPSGQGEDPSSEGLGGHHLLTQTNPRQPGAVGGKAARRHVVQPDAVLEVAYGGMATVVGLQFQHFPIPVNHSPSPSIPTSSEHTGGDTGAENLALQTEVTGLRELVDLYRERLTDADWRYQELLEQLKTMTKALPAAQDAAPRPNRWWWPFR